MKAVPGHKTDIKDSEWIAELLRHGLLSASFIPPKPIRDLRDLVRARKTLVYQRTGSATWAGVRSKVSGSKRFCDSAGRVDSSARYLSNKIRSCATC